jgi:DNA-binding response OmpR family regulator
MIVMGPLLIIVDDDTAAAHDLSHELAAFGFNVRGPARTPADGRKLLQAELPKIALVSTEFPDGENGLAFAHELRARGVHVIMMGDGPAGWTGAYIYKPIEISSVVDLIASGHDSAFSGT